jgi:PAS domain S-box-containing protein
MALSSENKNSKSEPNAEIEQLKAECNRYKYFFNAVNVALITVKNNIIIDYNKKAFELFNLENKRLADTSIFDLLPELQPDGRQSAEILKSAFTNSVSGKISSIEFRFNGLHNIPLDTKINITPSLVNGATEFNLEIYNIAEKAFAEIDLQKRNSEIETLYEERESLNEELQATLDELVEINKQLTESENWNKSVIQNIPFGLIIYRKGKFEYLNQKIENILGYTLAELYNISFFEHAIIDDKKIVQDFIQQLKLKKNNFETGFWIETKNMCRKYIRCSAEKMNNDIWMILVADLTDIKEREIDLSDYKDRLNFALATANTCIWDIDFDTNKIVYQENWHALLGYEKNELNFTVEVWRSLMHPDDVEKIKQEFSLHQSGIKPFYEMEYRIKTKNKGWKWVLSRGKLYKNIISGNYSRFIGVSFDIDDLKSMDLKLKFSEAKFAKAFNTSIDNIIITKLPEGTIIDVNDGFINSTGLTREEVLGKTSLDIPGGPNMKDNIEQFTQKLLTEGRIHNLEIEWELEPGEIRYSLFSAELTELNGEYYVINNIRDITDRKNAELKVAQSEESFRAILQNLSDVVWLVDQNMTITYETPSASKLLGYEPGYFIGKNGIEFIHPEDYALAKKDFIEVLQKQNDYKPTELRFKHKDGHWIYVETVADNLLEHPAVGSILITSHDISERKINEKLLKKYRNHLEQLVKERTEEIEQINAELIAINQELTATNIELAEANDKLKFEIQKREIAQALLEESENKFRNFIEQSTEGISLIDEQGRFVEWNKAMESIFHVSRNDMINTYSWEFDYRFLPDKRKTREMFDELKNSILNYFANPDSSIIITYEGFFHTMEFKQKYLTVNVFPIITPNGKYLGRIVRDITNIRRAQEEIKRQSDELQIINESLEQQKVELEKAMHDLKKTQSQLVESEKMASLGVLTAGIAHEINNPVNYINTGLEGLRIVLEDGLKVVELFKKLNEANYNEYYAEIEELKQSGEIVDLQKNIGNMLTNMQTGVDRITDIVKSLRSFSRGEDKELRFASIHEIIDSVLVMLHNQYKNRINIVKEYQILPSIKCYPGRLNQVFMNVVSNAVHAIPEKGVITIKTSHNVENDEITISIKDSGAGISKEIIDKIFEPFFTTKEVGKGTGLGLSISYSIVKQHQGEIIVKSNPDFGTEFIITLPVFPKKKK